VTSKPPLFISPENHFNSSCCLNRGADLSPRPQKTSILDSITRPPAAGPHILSIYNTTSSSPWSQRLDSIKIPSDIYFPQIRRAREFIASSILSPPSINVWYKLACAPWWVSSFRSPGRSMISALVLPGVTSKTGLALFLHFISSDITYHCFVVIARSIANLMLSSWRNVVFATFSRPLITLSVVPPRHPPPSDERVLLIVFRVFYFTLLLSSLLFEGDQCILTLVRREAVINLGCC